MLGMKRSTGRHLVWILLAACLCAATPTAALAQRKKAGKGKLSDKAPEKPQDYSSRNFLLHSDLSPKEAHELLTRLETMLGLISTYWQRPSRGIIECYVAKDLDKWPAGSLRPEGRAKIAEGAGITLTQVISVGDQFKAKAVVYATADHGTPQHEAVHAYCGQAFGRTGPTWYSEGMAEMGQYWRKSDKRVQIGEYVLEYLQKSEPKSLREIVERNQFTGDSWQNYSWRWALCHLLANNPNYASRFRPLGMGLLTEQPVSFELTYGAMANEISFEYIFFIDHLENGLRADLCAWDWKKKFTPLKNTSKTLAARCRGTRMATDRADGGQGARLRSVDQWQVENVQVGEDDRR